MTSNPSLALTNSFAQTIKGQKKEKNRHSINTILYFFTSSLPFGHSTSTVFLKASSADAFQIQMLFHLLSLQHSLPLLPEA